MACPYFEPVAPLEGGPAVPLPLGDVYDGVCRADPAARWSPARAVLVRHCNLGYAHDCPRLPRNGGPDAVRFTVAADHGAVLKLYYVLEKDHLPFAHGPVEYHAATDSLHGARWGELVELQARAYLASYQRRRGARHA